MAGRIPPRIIYAIMKNNSFVEILDTTLCDGEQTPGVSFSPQEKLDIARMLLSRLHIDRMEIASAGVSDNEAEAVRDIISWADGHGMTEKLEILGFIDNGKSLRWIRNTGAKTVNFLLPQYSIKARTSFEDKGLEDTRPEPVYRYVLKCQDCGTEIRRQKKSAAVEHPERYRCKCGGRLRRIQ